MIDDLRMLRDKLEVAEEELKFIPRAEWNRRKIEDRVHAIETMKRQIAQLERMHRAFIDRRHELLIRCSAFASTH